MTLFNRAATMKRATQNETNTPSKWSLKNELLTCNDLDFHCKKLEQDTDKKQKIYAWLKKRAA
jgi:hypothetical protein